MKTALTIAGFDPSGGAGIQADLKTFQRNGVYGLSVAASLTAQNSAGVVSVIPVKSQIVKKQLSVLLADMTPDATKIGMLYSEANVRTVAQVIRKAGLKNIVIDPVIFSSSGKRLAERGSLRALKINLIPLSTVITPNIYEASFLAGTEIRNVRDMKKAALLLHEYGVPNVIITGGHLKKTATDLLYNGAFYELEGRRRTGDFHGTGCIFSAAIASFLADGKSVLKAAEMAKDFIMGAFMKSFSTGKGMRLFHI